MSSIAVVGAGAWGTALALHAARAGNRVTLIARDSSAVRRIREERQSRQLPGFPIPPQIDIRSDIPDGVELCVWVVPTQYLRSSLARLGSAAGPLVVCAKGVEADSHLLPLEVVLDVCGAKPLAVLTGPNFAN